MALSGARRCKDLGDGRAFNNYTAGRVASQNLGHGFGQLAING